MRAAGEASSIPSEPNRLVALVTNLLERVDRLEAGVTRLQAENVALRAENAKLETNVNELRADNTRLRRENAWLKKQLFGPKRERVDPGRLHAAWLRFQKEAAVEATGTQESGEVFSGPSTAIQLLLGLAGTAVVSPPASASVATTSSADISAAPMPPAPPAPESRPARHKHGRSPLPEHLPIERVVLEPVEIPSGARRIGEEVSERIGHRKASYVRVLVVRPQYAMDTDDEATHVVIAPPPDEMIPRGLCDPEMLAHLVMSKWGDHQPWNRLAGICRREGLPLSATTMAGVATRAEPLAKRVVEAMWCEARSEAKVLAIDATTAKVQAKDKCHRGYPWVVVADRDHVLFDFSKRHASETPEKLLRGFRGYVLADASSVYDRLFDAEDAPLEAGCWSHCRRGLFYAAPSDERALVGVKLADELFASNANSRS